MTVTSTESLGVSLGITGIEKSYLGRQVLQRVDLEVRPAEFVTLVGKSGCGKSTLLRLVAGLDEPDAGEIRVGAQLVRGTSIQARMVFQNHRLLPWKTVAENIAFGAARCDEEEIEAMIVRLGLVEQRKALPRTLSGGEKQRVALARALVAKPGLLLFDEPLSALDALTRIGMQRWVEELWLERRFTGLLITHDVDEAIVLADRVVVLEDGVVDFEIEVDLPRPRARTGDAFDRIRNRILSRILGISEGVEPHRFGEVKLLSSLRTDSRLKSAFR